MLAGTEYRAARQPGYWLVYDADPGSPGFQRVSRTEVVELDHIGGASLENLLPDVYRPFVNIDTASSLVVVQADSALGREIVTTIERVDVPRRHVLLDARVVVIEQSRLNNIGFEWTWPSAEAGTYTSKALDGTWPWELGIGLSTGAEFTDALMLNLDLLKQNDEASILSSPQVVSQSGKSAEIKVATEEYFKITTEGIYERLQLEKIETGTTLNITPVVGDEGTITLEVSAEVSDVIARGSDNLPVVNRRTAQSTIRLEDGGTAAIAGLLAARQRQGQSRVPILGSLPLLGTLFRKNENQNVSKQLAIFITARLLQDQQDMLAAGETTPRPVPLVDEDAFRDRVRQSLERLYEEDR
jgi:type II secretory pathway component GspD/PulD (secretin)